MENAKIQLLQNWGCDTQSALERLDGDWELYLECLQMFCDDENFAQLSAALDANNTQEAFQCAHTLKGVAINFGILPLLDAISDVVEPLRDGDIAQAQDNYKAFTITKTKYDTIVMGEKTN